MAVTLPIPPGTALILDDECVTGLALVNITTGAIIGYTDAADFACGSEVGMVMLDGTICTPNHSLGISSAVGIYNKDLSLRITTNVGVAGNSFPIGVTTDRLVYFYIIAEDISDNLFLYQIDKNGNILNFWDLSTVTIFHSRLACAVTRDNTFLYFKYTNSGVIKKIDLSTGTVTTAITLASEPDWLGIDTNNIYVIRNISGIGTSELEKYDLDFNFIDSVTTEPAGYRFDTADFYFDDAHVIAWVQKLSGMAHPNVYSVLRKIKLSDLSIVSDSPDIPTESDSDFITPGSEISNSCPLMISASDDCAPNCEPCSGGLRRIEIHLNGTRIASAQSTSANELILPLSYLVEGLRNDVITVVAYQSNDWPISIIPSVQMHRVTYVTHDKAVGRNRPETIDPRSGATETDGVSDCDENIHGDCADCDPVTIPPPNSNIPAWFAASLVSNGATNCYTAEVYCLMTSDMNDNGFTPQHNSASECRGRMYLGYPVPDYNKWVDNVRPDCGWGWFPNF